MAVAALAPADPVLKAKADLPVQLANLDQSTKDLQPKLDTIEKKTEGDVTTLEQNRQGIETERGKIPFPQLEKVPYDKPKETDPQHMWGSAAMLFAAIGSAMTRQPMNTALNAAASVLTAYRKGDQDAANAAYQTWKVSTDNAIKVHEFQVEAYKDAMASIDRREAGVDRQEKTATEAGDRAERNAIAAVNALGHSFNDAAMADVKTIADADRVMAERDRLAQRLSEQGPKIEEQHDAAQAVAALKATPEYQHADATQKFRMTHDLLHKTAPNIGKQVTAQMKAKLTAIKDEMNAYQKSKGGIVPANDPHWADLSRKEQAAESALIGSLGEDGGDAPAGGDQPPAPGAKKAPDGNWYVPDPKRPGKYLKVG